MNGKKHYRRSILIGASTGGVDATVRVISVLQPVFPPVVIVQHTGRDFGVRLAQVLQTQSGQQVQHVDPHVETELIPSHVYVVAGTECHAVLDDTDKLKLVPDSSGPVSGHRPSIDVMFRSAVSLGQDVVACLLTGMGKDGAAGLKSLRDAGATTFVQDEETSAVYGMPKAAWELGAASRKLPIDEIGHAVMTQVQGRRHAR